MPTQAIYAEPTDLESARLLIDAISENPTRQEETARFSVHSWSAEGCHWFALAAKGSHLFDRRNIAGDTLRSLANLAIIREHQQRKP